MHIDLAPYYRFTSKARLEKSVNSLLGIIEGIAADADINPTEISFLRNWLDEYLAVASLHPFNELVPVVIQAVEDGILSEEEQHDIKWLCEKLRRGDYFDAVTSDMQRLHALVGGIAADGEVTEAELRGLSQWLAEHDQLKTCWPYDEIDSLVTKVMSDGRIDDEEHRLVQGFFSEFITLLDNRTIGLSSSDGRHFPSRTMRSLP